MTNARFQSTLIQLARALPPHVHHLRLFTFHIVKDAAYSLLALHSSQRNPVFPRSVHSFAHNKSTLDFTAHPLLLDSVDTDSFLNVYSTTGLDQLYAYNSLATPN